MMRDVARMETIKTYSHKCLDAVKTILCHIALHVWTILYFTLVVSAHIHGMCIPIRPYLYISSTQSSDELRRWKDRRDKGWACCMVAGLARLFPCYQLVHVLRRLLNEAIMSSLQQAHNQRYFFFSINQRSLWGEKVTFHFLQPMSALL